jgi:hypothetical protein
VLSAALAAAPRALCETLVILDYWWLKDYAKNSCRLLSVAPLGTAPEREVACADPAYPDMHHFISELETHFTVNLRCHNITFMTYNVPDKHNSTGTKNWSDPHWTLIIDYNPGLNVQGWSLLKSTEAVLYESTDKPEKIANDVCSILAGRGGTIVH